MSTEQSNAAPPPPHIPAAPLAWEARRGFAGGFLDTLVQVLVFPGRAFQSKAVTDWQRPFLFAAIVNLALLLVNLAGWPPVVAGTPPVTLVLFRALGLAVALPLVALFLSVVLRFVAGHRGGFLPVFRVAAYAEVSGLFILLPQVGQMVQLVWIVFILTAGLTAALRLVMWRVLVSVLLTYVLMAMAVSASGILGRLL